MNSKRSNTSWIVIHCSATRAVQDIGVREIRKWHQAQGWADVGYHFVVRRSGKVEKGRDVDLIGAHVQGHNHNSVAICMVGGIGDNSWRPTNNFTPQQWVALEKLVRSLTIRYPRARVLGHRDFAGVTKACPCFSAKAWAKKLKLPT